MHEKRAINLDNNINYPKYRDKKIYLNVSRASVICERTLGSLIYALRILEGG